MMPLVTDPSEAREIYQKLALRRKAMPAFCTENRRTTVAVLEAAQRYACETDQKDLPVVLAFTGTYPPRPQMLFYTSTRKWEDGLSFLGGDVDTLIKSSGSRLRVMLHLDHADPVRDRPIILSWVDRLASVMCDASTRRMDENIQETRKFVEEFGGRLLVEGAVDEIPEYGEETEPRYTTPEEAARFFQATGVDLVVANVGTEHRTAASGKAVYRADIARSIRDQVGHRMVLHGSSCLEEKDLAGLGEDGFVRINAWTGLERVGGVAVARDILDHLNEVLPKKDREEYVRKGILAKDVGEAPDRGSSLGVVSETHRRDEVWMPAVVDYLQSFMRALES